MRTWQTLVFAIGVALLVVAVMPVDTWAQG